jgi:spore germination cell wall hydrolase CwlJ-like protein
VTEQDERDTQLCIWKEARGEGNTGMMVVGCVIRNRAIRHNQTWGQVVWKKWAFSSMTDPKDPQFHKQAPSRDDIEWLSYVQAQQVVLDLMNPATPDITNGATLYYDDSIKFPQSWNPKAVIPVGKIGRLNLFREV